MRGAVLGLLVLLVAYTPLAQAEPVVERHLVSFHGTAPEEGARLLSALVVESFPFARVAVLEGPAPVFSALAALPGVAGVYPDEPLTLNLDRARGVARADPPAGGPGAAGWPTGRNVTVALVDSGIDAQHPGFEGRVAASVRIPRSGGPQRGAGDDEGHGTHVAGIVGGSGAASEDRRMRGFAPEARLVAVDISDSFTTSSAVRAFAWIHEHRHQHGIRVVSNSWGREKDDARYDADDPVIRASDALVADGLVVVFSAGNRGRDGAASLTVEATNPNVLTVGAVSAAGRPEAYSSRGPARDGAGNAVAWVKPDLVAAGTGIVSARASSLAPPAPRGEEDRHYVAMNGTSMAAPQVAAAAALLLDAHPELRPGMVAAILTGTARDVGAAGPDPVTGHGLLDVTAALRAAETLEGGDVLVHEERRVPIRREGTATAAQDLVLLAQGAAQLPPARAVSLPVSFPAGAASVDLWFNWSGPGAFDVVLKGPQGEVPFQRDGQGRLRLSRPAAEGLHTLEARPTGPATSAAFTLEGSVLVREAKLVEGGAPAFRVRAEPTGAGFSVSASGSERLVGLFETAPLLVLALAAGLVTVATAAWTLRRRR